MSGLSAPKTLWEAEFKGDGLVNLAEAISKHQSTEAVAWLLLAAFGQVSRAPKAEPKPLKNMKSGQILTVVDKEFCSSFQKGRVLLKRS